MDYAYTAVVTNRGSMVGRVDRGTSGYTPMPEYGSWKRHDAAEAKAEELNDTIGVDKLEALDIVCGTMFPGYRPGSVYRDALEDAS